MSARLDGPLLITMGDPAGIGPELILQLFQDHPDVSSDCLVLADEATLREAQKWVGANVQLQRQAPDRAHRPAAPGTLPFWHIDGLDRPVTKGQIQVEAGQVAARCIRTAVEAVWKGQGAALVTAPIHKEAWALAGMPYPGHTEYLQALAAAQLGCAPEALPVRMMLSNTRLSTVLQSIHLPLRQAIERVTIEGLLETLQIIQRHVPPPEGRSHCRIAVAGLNPHAGEGGLLGWEEQQIIEPAVQAARASGLEVSGPYAPDTVFMRAAQGEFDVVLAMYHDQGLIPVKLDGWAGGVNTTLGLPLIRTSPDHGTAFDLAGSGRADASSLWAAVEMARQLVHRARQRSG